jgi:integrase
LLVIVRIDASCSFAHATRRLLSYSVGIACVAIEILALQRCNVAADGSSVRIEQRVRGDLDAPKNGKTRVVAVPPRAAAMLVEWLEAAVDSEPTAWVFASENRETPLWRDNLLRRHIRPALEKVGLGWVDFKLMRRTNATLGHSANVDPKMSADQRGHGIGVSLDVYTRSSIGQKAVAAKKLEDSVLGKKGRADAQAKSVVRAPNVVQESAGFWVAVSS